MRPGGPSDDGPKDAFGYTWPRLVPHVSILLTGALLSCGLVAVLTGRTGWLATGALALGFTALLGLNALDPDAFIADRNLARAERDLPLDPWEPNTLSADAVPTIVEALPTLDPATRSVIEGDRRACARTSARVWPGSVGFVQPRARRRAGTG